VACHVTLRLGVIHAMEKSYHVSIARSVTCMGRLVSRLESIPISLLDLTATISSSRPIRNDLPLTGREHSGRLVGSRDLMLPITTIPRGARVNSHLLVGSDGDHLLV